MIKITLSEKYVLLTRNEDGAFGTLFGQEKQGLYVSALLELFCDQIVSCSKKVKVESKLSDENQGIKRMYDFVCEKEGKSVASIMRSYMGPFNMKNRGELKNEILTTLKIKEQTFEAGAYKDEMIDKIKTLNFDDLEIIVLTKLLIELRLIKKCVSKEKAKELKLFFKNNDTFSEEIKQVMKAIESLATAGALAGAGVV